MNKEQKYNDALRRAKELHEAGNVLTKTQMEIIFPELAESEEERIRKEIISALKFANDSGVYDRHIAYLEKQKERDLDIVPELRATAWGEGYQHGRKDTEEKYSGMMVCSPEEWNEAISDAFKHGMDEGEKQKEKKPNIELIQKSWYMEGYHDREFNKEPKWIIKTGEGGPRYEENPKYGQHIEEKPAEWSEDFDKEVENVHKRYPEVSYAKLTRIAYHFSKWANRYKGIKWSEEDESCWNLIWDILDGSFTASKEGYKKAAAWFLKNCPKKQKEQKPAEKQDYSGLNELERAIHRGFLCAGVVNVPVNIIKETAQDCLAQLKSAEWSEEDERILKGIIGKIDHDQTYGVSKVEMLSFLKSLRPSWKPSEEQMKALQNAVALTACNKELVRLYNQLKKLAER